MLSGYYQTFPFVMFFKNDCKNCTVVVISPLITLMGEQVRGLRKKGLKAFIMTSSKSLTEGNITINEGLVEDKLFFCAPAALVVSKWSDAFK